MTRKIFKNLCLVAATVFLASLVLIMGVLYGYFSQIQQTQLRMQTDLAAQGVEAAGADYLDGLHIRDYRITWIGADGDVLYDSAANSNIMENHLQREEVRQALSAGHGESSRYSATLLERSLYTARRLSDGSVLRLSIAQNTVLTMLLGMGQGLVQLHGIGGAPGVVHPVAGFDQLHGLIRGGQLAFIHGLTVHRSIVLFCGWHSLIR